MPKTTVHILLVEDKDYNETITAYATEAEAHAAGWDAVTKMVMAALDDDMKGFKAAGDFQGALEKLAEDECRIRFRTAELDSPLISSPSPVEVASSEHEGDEKAPNASLKAPDDRFSTLPQVLRAMDALIRWMSENTSPRDENSPHHILVTAEDELARFRARLPG